MIFLFQAYNPTPPGMPSMFSFMLVPILFFIVAIGLNIVMIYFIYTWVNKYLHLKQEQNDLLKEIIQKIGDKMNPDK